MSQAGILDVEKSNPQIPTLFVADTGSAIPVNNTLNIFGDGVNVATSGSGSTITISASSGVGVWTDVTAASQAMAVNHGYTANRGTQITFTLPAIAAYGSLMAVVGKGAGGWRITQNAGQIIHFGISNTTVTTGSLASTKQYNSVYLLCTVANTEFTVVERQGNLTVI